MLANLVAFFTHFALVYMITLGTKQTRQGPNPQWYLSFYHPLNVPGDMGLDFQTIIKILEDNLIVVCIKRITEKFVYISTVWSSGHGPEKCWASETSLLEHSAHLLRACLLFVLDRENVTMYVQLCLLAKNFIFMALAN